MTAGSCFCGQVKIKYTGQPVAAGLCHCTDCRKISGSSFSYSIIVKTSDIEVTGNPKHISKQADSGAEYKNYFCPDCGTPLYGHKVTPNGDSDETSVLRAGILDDMEMLNRLKPALEIYTDKRIDWVVPAEGAAQFGGMPPHA